MEFLGRLQDLHKHFRRLVPLGLPCPQLQKVVSYSQMIWFLLLLFLVSLAEGLSMRQLFQMEFLEFTHTNKLTD